MKYSRNAHKARMPLIEITGLERNGVVLRDSGRRTQPILPERFYRLTLEVIDRNGQTDTVPVLPRLTLRQRIVSMWRRV